MASKEKKPLASSKSKPKANNNSGISSSIDNRTKRSKLLFPKRQIEWQRMISTTVVTGTSLPTSKLDTNLPRKKALESLVRQQKLKSPKSTKASKSTIVKAKKKVPFKSLKIRVSGGARKIIRADKNEEEDEEKAKSEEEEDSKNNIKPNGKKKACIFVKKAESPKSAKSQKRKRSTDSSTSNNSKIKDKCSIDLTIDEVIASSAMEKECKIEKEDDSLEEDACLEDGPEDSKKASNQRIGLRNGKLRQFSDSETEISNCPFSTIESSEDAAEAENNNEAGPMLRSKTKKDEDALRKERILAKFSAEKAKCRRNSLNIDMKKAVTSFHPVGDKSDGTSQIDQMIENIKMTIVKSIESKIFGAEKELILGKNFGGEMVAVVQEEENSLPKVADTAKEIEKLVMGDAEFDSPTDKKEEPAAEFPVFEDEKKVDEEVAEVCGGDGDGGGGGGEVEKMEIEDYLSGSLSPKVPPECDSGDIETLESISLEVERLITETPMEQEEGDAAKPREEENACSSDNCDSNPKRVLRARDKKSEDGKKTNSPKSRRSRKEQNKEETLLDNEVAEINENKGSSNSRSSNCRGFSEPSSENPREPKKEEIRCKSEPRRRVAFCHREAESNDRVSANVNPSKSLDSDEASTSGESLSSLMSSSMKILETPEDMAMKESILGMLGLTPLEKLGEHQKKKEQFSTGTLKTVIRVQKEKKRSRSPLKMVLKQQGRGDGDGESFEFYTIQKELGTTSGLGDSSSGANRKFRYFSEDDNEETPAKDRQSLVIPEKSSSFSIHPGRLCADVCCYCFGKFGSLDTPMHLAQMKSDDRRKKILNVERHLTKDSCLCDACYRHVDRKAHVSPTNPQPKPQKQHRQLMVSKCSARDCKETAKHNVKRRWLVKIKVCLQNQVDIDWESSQHSSMSFCPIHYPKIEKFLTCGLCKRRLAKNQTHLLPATETDELNQRLEQNGVPVPLIPGTFVCKLCRYFTQLQMKKDVENMSSNTKNFYTNYRKRILQYHDIEDLDNDEEDALQKEKEKEKPSQKNKPIKCIQSKKASEGVVEKSSPESSKPQFLSIESTIEKLKKRKALDAAQNLSQSVEDVVEILAMDKEVTLTRLPKRPRTSNDITPVVQRLGANPSISVRTLFPGEEDMNLHANVEFGNVREVTPQGWEKCSTMIQYDRETKLLWQELQRPYGNQSSFLRHLILLEKYYRAGDLVLAPNASRNAINYSTSVQNRLISFEGPEKMDEPIMEPISEYNNPQQMSGGCVQETNNVFKLNRGVSLIKKPPPNLQRLSLPSTSSPKRKEPSFSGGKVFQLSEPDFKRFQNLKKQKISQQSMAQTQFQKHLRMQQEMLNRQTRGDFEPLICDSGALANENSPTQNLLHNLNLPKSIQVTTKPPVPLSIPIMPKIPKSLTVIPQTVTKPVEK